jgi:hypothetical protein
VSRLALALLALFCLALAAPAHGAPKPAASPTPCLTATSVCVEWVTLGGGPARAMVYRTYPLDARNLAVRRALIMVHGTLRNADHYFTTATGAAFLAGALGDTLVIAPAFHSSDPDCEDKLQPHEVSWTCHGDSWRSGGSATSDPALSSFDFVDTILGQISNRALFPNLREIVIAGHSAGAQFVARYAMANRVHDHLGAPLVYVVANPSSYAWPDASRPAPVEDAAPAAAAGAWASEALHTHFAFAPFDAARAPAFNHWPYGLEGRTGGYTRDMSDDALRAQLTSRPITLLLGQVDTFPLGGFDDSPEAMAQGATRRARGEAFVAYVNGRLGGHIKPVIVPECGHNDRCVFTSETVLPLIFP